MKESDLTHQESLLFLDALSKVQIWENANAPFLRTVAGRQLYFGLVRHFVNTDSSNGISNMKDVYCDQGVSLTERGLRLTIRAFEAEGELVVDKGAGDRRFRRIFVTEKLVKQMQSHAMEIRKAINQHYWVIKK